MYKQALILSIFFLLASCASIKPSAGTSTAYTEDISGYLPPIPTDTTIQHPETAPATMAAASTPDPVAQQLDSVLILANNYIAANTRYIEGLTIQLYSGNDRNEAKNEQFKAIRYFPDGNPRLIFDQPNYKVRMGSFYTSLEAYPEFKKAQEKFPKAILVPTRIKLIIK